MTWRMIEKAAFLYRKETAARRSSATDEVVFIAAPAKDGGPALVSCDAGDATLQIEASVPSRQQVCEIGGSEPASSEALASADDLEQGCDSAAAPGAATKAGPDSSASPSVMCGWRQQLGGADGGGGAAPPAEGASAMARIEKEDACQLPAMQVSLLVLILVAVAVTNITGGFMVGSA